MGTWSATYVKSSPVRRKDRHGEDGEGVGTNDQVYVVIDNSVTS